MDTQEIIKRSGGALAVSIAVNLTRQAVYAWPHVPAKHVDAIVALSGLDRATIRPDLYGEAALERAALRMRLAKLEAQG